MVAIPAAAGAWEQRLLLMLSLQTCHVCPVRHLERSCGQPGTRQGSASCRDEDFGDLQGCARRGWSIPYLWEQHLQGAGAKGIPRELPPIPKPRWNTLNEGILGVQVP